MEGFLKETRDLFVRNTTMSSIDSYHLMSNDNHFKLEVQYSTPDPMNNTTSKTVRSYTLDTANNKLTDDQNVNIVDDSVLLQKYNSDGRYKYLLSKSQSGFLLDVYEKGKIKDRKVIPSSIHAAPIRHRFITSEFMMVSEDSNRIMYIAESGPSNANIFKLKDSLQDRFKYRDNFGDWMGTFKYPTIFVYDINDQQLYTIDKPEVKEKEIVVYIHPKFGNREGTTIVCTAINIAGVSDQAYFTNSPKTLRIFNNLTKERSLPTSNLTLRKWKDESIYTDKHISAEIEFYPKLSKDFSKLSFFFIPTCTTPALNMCGLKVLDMNTLEVSTIVDIIEEDHDEFAGINGHHMTLYSYDWINNNTLIINSHHHQCPSVYEVDINTKIVKRVPSNAKNLYINESAYMIGTIVDDIFVVRRDTIDYNGMMRIMRRMIDGSFICIHDDSDHLPVVDNFEKTIYVNGIEAAFYGRKSNTVPMNKRPLIVYLHGGPHTIYPSVYNPLIEYCLNRMFTVLNVNFRGSNGRGSNFALSGCGQCGEKDMNEIRDCIVHMISEGQCDEKEVHLYGTSTGGYLTLSMISRYPEIAKSAVIYSPVSDVYSMMLESTAINWINGEVLGNTNHDELLKGISDENVLKLRDRSSQQMEYSNTRTKVFIYRGKLDELVPSYPIQKIYARLRNMNVDVRLFEYNEQHHFLSLDHVFDSTVKSIMLLNNMYHFL